MPLCAKCPECRPRCSPGHACQEWVCAITGAQVLPGNGVHASPEDALAELIENSTIERPNPPVRPCDDTGKEICPLHLFPRGLRVDHHAARGMVAAGRAWTVQQAKRRGMWDRLLAHYDGRPKEREMLASM